MSETNATTPSRPGRPMPWWATLGWVAAGLVTAVLLVGLVAGGEVAISIPAAVVGLVGLVLGIVGVGLRSRPGA